MAIHAHSIPAPTVQPRLSRCVGTVPCRVLTDADVIALTLMAESLASVRDALVQTLTLIHRAHTNKETHPRQADTPLDTLQAFFEPSFSAAISRRREVLGNFDGGSDHV